MQLCRHVILCTMYNEKEFGLNLSKLKSYISTSIETPKKKKKELNNDNI